jgi:hypothetical protein
MRSSWGFSIWRSENGEFFPVEMVMEEKILPKEVWGWYFILRLAKTLFSKFLLK